MFRKTLLFAALTVAAFPAPAQSTSPMQRAKSSFDRIDANGDGVVTRAEFRTTQAARWPQIDRNRDGYLTLDDFPRNAAQRASAQLAGIADLDADKDGRISQAEFLDGSAAAFEQVDQNADQILTRSEVDRQGS